MPILPYKNPLAYRQLRTWQQANEILELTEKFVKTLPKDDPARGHMDRSARSTFRNIEEGFRRTTTNEYISFLGFSAGSNEELLGDFEHCLRRPLCHSERSEESRRLAEKGFRLCKGESTMLHRQITALQGKMVKERTLSANDRARFVLEKQKQRQEKGDRWLAEQMIRIKKEDKGD